MRVTITNRIVYRDSDRRSRFETEWIQTWIQVRIDAIRLNNDFQNSEYITVKINHSMKRCGMQYSFQLLLWLRVKSIFACSSLENFRGGPLYFSAIAIRNLRDHQALAALLAGFRYTLEPHAIIRVHHCIDNVSPQHSIIFYTAFILINFLGRSFNASRILHFSNFKRKSEYYVDLVS